VLDLTNSSSRSGPTTEICGQTRNRAPRAGRLFG
jgi:hypothetical protein